MSSIKYNGTRVNAAVEDIRRIANQFSSLSTNIRSATNQIVSARGFQEYVGGISSDTFSGYVEQCGAACSNLTQNIRQKEVDILAYSQDRKAINAFVDQLTNNEYRSLDLSEIEKYISLDRKAGKLFQGIGSTLATAGLGLVEGIADFGETGADLITLGGTLFNSIFTKTYDILTGSHTTEKMWEETKAEVSQKKVESAFNRFYSDTEIGQSIKNNAYGFDTVRGIGKGLGYTAGVIGVNILTGGLAAGGIGAAGSISAGQLAATAGLMGFSNGTEEAWADGATIEKGLAYGVAAGAWEGLQWYAGAKINQYGGVGDRVAKGLFKGAEAGVYTRIAMDTVDSGLEGFVQPALTMIYKDYGGSNLVENYKTAFAAAGGWSNVASQAAMGAIGSAIGEYSGARRLLKSADEESMKKAGDVFKSNGTGSANDLVAFGAAGGDAAAYRMLDSTDDVFADANFSGNRKYTIDGSWIRNGDTPFNTKTSTTIPKSYTWFMDGTYLPDDLSNPSALKGVFSHYEKNISTSEFVDLVNKNRSYMSGADYTAWMEAAKVFNNHGLDVNMNGMKLIMSYSNGNAARIRSALSMSYSGLSDETLDQLSKTMSRELFPQTGNASVVRALTDDLITDMQKKGTDNWRGISSIMGTVDNDQLLRNISADSVELRANRTARYFGNYLSEDAVQKIAASDGYPSTIRAILAQENNIPPQMLDTLSSGTAANVFKNQNLARMKSCLEINNGNIDTALRLVTNEGISFNGYSDLFKATNVFSDKASHYLYYHLVDNMVDGGIGLDNAVSSVKLMNAQAMTALGKDATPMLVQATGPNASRNMLFKWNSDVLDSVDNSALRNVSASDYLIRKYADVNGRVYYESVISDFENLVNRKNGGLSNALASSGNMRYDLQNSSRANKTFLQSYIDAARDTNNPNRAEAVSVMGKILELNDQGKKLLVFNDGGMSGSYHQKGSIHLDFSTIDGGHSTTVFHESGHYLYDTALGAKYPTGFESIRTGAVSNLTDSANKQLMSAYGENINEVRYYCNYRSEKQFSDVVKANGFANVDAYRDHLTAKYMNMSESAREDYMGKTSTKYGSVHLEDYRGTAKRFDFKNAEDCANFQINTIKSKTFDHIYRTQFGDYCATSSIIDSVTRGDTRYQYGHGVSYYLSKPDPNHFVYHELMADYTSMKASGNNSSIRFLRTVLGDEIMNQLDADYRRMIK